MFKQKTLLLAITGSLILPGCANLIPDTAPSVLATMTVRNGGVSQEDMYRIGRYYQGQLRYAEAEQAFLDVLKLNPAHAEAHNALGATYFAQGRITKAEEQFQLAIAAAPNAAHLRNNLARLHAMTGKVSQPTGSASVAEVSTKQDEKNTPATAAAPLNSPAKSADAAAQSASVPQANQPSAKLASVAPGVWELNLRSAQPTAVASYEKTAAMPAAMRIEISNGNGVSGLAKRVGTYLQVNGYAKPRLTNHASFKVARTEVQYLRGAEAQAQELLTTLRSPARLVQANTLDRKTKVRVIIGHDFRETPAIAEAGMSDRLAANTAGQASAGK
ncbi:MAG: LytR C-terminal domain-containing protein [Burkholderiales bacterium]|nr:LytR C-terminal domain-containing protein [Burkholderiales bacterium]